MDNLVPTIRDLRPYPESAEAVAQGCHCAIARHRGKPLITRNGAQVFAIAKECPVHDNRLRELPIWDERAPAVPPIAPAIAPIEWGTAITSPASTRTQPSAPQARNEAIPLDLQAGHRPRLVRHRVFAPKLPHAKTLEGFEFGGTGIDEVLVRRLHSGNFLAAARNVVFVGGTGTGKTHLAIALADQLIRQGKRGRFYTAVDLVDRLEREWHDGNNGAISRECAHADFIVIDELGYVPISKQGGSLLFQLLGKLHETTSVILTTHLAFAEWATFFGDAKLSAVLIDRINHHCTIVHTGTRSWRSRERDQVEIRSNSRAARTPVVAALKHGMA